MTPGTSGLENAQRDGGSLGETVDPERSPAMFNWAHDARWFGRKIVCRVF
jgi:hypothetical protein